MKSENDTDTKSEERQNRHRRKNCYTMYEVAEILDVSEWTIRLWVDRFKILKPLRNKKGMLLFTSAEVDMIETINRLSKEKGMTLEKARKYFESIEST